MRTKGTANLLSDNRGLSLVELIVAISIGVIVSGAIAALMTYAIRVFRNESVNTEMQYELQTNTNMIVDEIMSASVFVIEQNSGAEKVDADDNPITGTPYTKYALFGKPNATIKVGSEYKKGFKGVIFVSSAPADGKFKIYMDRIEEQIPSGKTLAQFATTKTGIQTEQYLLGDNVTQFVIDPVAGALKTEGTYTNPIEFEVELDFEKAGWESSKYNKHVKEITYMRNKATQTVYLKGASDSDFVGYDLK